MQIIKSSYTQVLAGISLLVGIAFLALQNDHVQDQLTQVNPPATQPSENVPEQKPLPVVSSDTQQSLNADKPKEEDIENAFEGREVKYRFQQIATQYAEEIQYPDFSRPITSEHKLLEYMPDRAVPSSRAINPDDANGEVQDDGPRIALETSQFKYYQGEQVTATATVTGITERSAVSVAGSVRVGRNVVAQARDVVFLDSDPQSGSRQFRLLFDDLSAFSQGSKGDMNVVAEFKIDGQSYMITSLIRYPAIIAQLERVGAAEVQGEYLNIPMHVSTSSPGMHAIKGNLYDVETNTPLVHLNAVERLTSESGVMVLKAHITALKKMGYEGPYELRDISLTRGASAPNYTVEYGRVDKSSYAVAGFSFNEYEDVAYVDERAQARLEFLTKLSR